MVATIFTSLAFLFSSVSMTNLSRLVAASFSSLALLSSSVSIDNPSCLLATTFSSLRLLSNSLSSSRFYLLRVGKRCYSWFSVFLFSPAFLSSVLQSLKPPQTDFEHARVWPRNSACAFWPHIYIIYHAKSRLNTPVWGSLRSPNNMDTSPDHFIPCSRCVCGVINHMLSMPNKSPYVT